MDVLQTRRFILTAAALSLCAAGLAAHLATQPKLDPITYVIRFPDPASKSFTVDVTVPTAKISRLAAFRTPE